MADLRLQYIKNNDSYFVLQPNKITNPQVGADFLEYYESLVTVMNVTEYPYNTKSGDGLFPAFSMIRFSDMSAQNVRTRAIAGVTYNFQIVIDDDTFTFTLQGENIQTYQQLVSQLQTAIPYATITYLPATVFREHKLRISSNTPPQTEIAGATPEDPPSILTQLSLVDINVFDVTVLNGDGRNRKITGSIPAFVELPLPRFGPEDLLLTPSVSNESDRLLVLNRGGDGLPLVVPNDNSITTIQELADHINENFAEIRATVLITYDPTVPTFDGEVGTIAMETVQSNVTNGEDTNLTLNSSSSSRSPTLVYALLLYIPLAEASKVTFPTDADTTEARQFHLNNLRRANLVGAAGNAHLVTVADMQTLAEKMDNKAYLGDTSCNGLTLFEVLQFTYPTAEASWAELLASAIREKPRNPFPLFDILNNLIGNIISRVGGFIGFTIGRLVDAAKIVKETLKEGIDDILNGISDPAGAEQSAAAELAAAAGVAIGEITTGAARMLAAAKVKAETFIADLVIAIQSPTNISAELALATSRVDNLSVTEVDAPFITVVEPPEKPDGEEVEDNSPEDIFEETTNTKDTPTIFQPAVPGSPLIDL